jgi:hypothetical protein
MEKTLDPPDEPEFEGEAIEECPSCGKVEWVQFSREHDWKDVISYSVYECGYQTSQIESADDYYHEG